MRKKKLTEALDNGPAEQIDTPTAEAIEVDDAPFVPTVESSASANTENDPTSAQAAEIPAADGAPQSEADEAPAEVSAEAQLRAEIETLREALHAAKQAATRRETELCCGRLLRERGISEELTAVLLAPGETEVKEETLQLRVAALAGAVEAAAVRALHERVDSVRPGAGSAAPLTGKMLRETPLATLAQIMT